MEKTIEIKLVKSLIGRIPKHIQIAKQLGLRKINSKVVHQDTPIIRGMVRVISYLVSIEEQAK